MKITTLLAISGILFTHSISATTPKQLQAPTILPSMSRPPIAAIKSIQSDDGCCTAAVCIAGGIGSLVLTKTCLSVPYDQYIADPDMRAILEGVSLGAGIAISSKIKSMCDKALHKKID